MEVEETRILEMPSYRCHKKVQALKIDIVTPTGDGEDVFLTFVDVLYGPTRHSIKDRPTPLPGWYLVFYDNGYHSFSPPEAFEEGYTLLSPDAIDFGQALKALEAGAMVTREGWNGKGMFLLLVPGSRFKVNRKPLLGIFPEGTEVNYRPHIDMKTADGQIVPWVASQSDLLATDWIIC